MGKETKNFISSDSHEKKEGQKEYDPIKVLRKREIGPDFIYVDEDGKETIDSEELTQIQKYLRKNVKKGSVLNLGGGFTHPHRMIPIADKITFATSVDIGESNNQVARELIESIKNSGKQKLVKKLDAELLKIMAGAVAKDKSYGISSSKEELLSMLYEKSQYKGKPDIITADIIAQMDQLGSGELVDNRTYDNILFLFSIFTRNRKETLNLVKNVKMRLNKGGGSLLWRSGIIQERTNQKQMFSAAKIK